MKEFGRNLAVSFFSFIFILAVSEILIRIFFPIPISIASSQYLVHETSDNPKLLYKLSPNKETYAFDVWHRINSAGFRDREYPVSKKQGTTRFVFLGDSVVYGYGVPVEDSIPKQLEKKLNDAGHAAEVLNLGVSGYETEQAIEFFKEVGLAYSPDVVIMGYTLNDSAFASMEINFFHDKAGRYVSQKTPIIGWIYEHSHLWRFLDRRLDLQKKFKKLRPYQGVTLWQYIDDRNKADQDPPGSPYQKLSSNIEDEGKQTGAAPDSIKSMKNFVGMDTTPMYSSHWNISKKALSGLAELSRNYHFKVVVVIFPYLEALDHYALTSVHEFVRNEVQGLGFDVIDLGPVIREQNAISGKKLNMDPVHFNAFGALVAGDFIASELVKRRLLETSKASSE